MLSEPELASPTENPDMNPPSTAPEIILLKASITKTKRRGERGSPCLRPLDGLKGLDGEPLTKIDKLEEVTKATTHLTQLWSNPYAIRTFLM